MRIPSFFIGERDFHGIRVLRPGDRVNNPKSVAVDSQGNVSIADTGKHAIRMVVGGALP